MVHSTSSTEPNLDRARVAEPQSELSGNARALAEVTAERDQGQELPAVTTQQRAEQLLAVVQAWYAAHPQESFAAQSRPCVHGGHPGEFHALQITPRGHAALDRAARDDGAREAG